MDMEIKTDIRLGDGKEVLKEYPENQVDLIITSPPYADARKKQMEEYIHRIM
jgi:site-specific DNA-methyltransferase (adenine-specific)/site-specific DNA-methyltransferase (cytosine-N4-specific)